MPDEGMNYPTEQERLAHARERFPGKSDEWIIAELEYRLAKAHIDVSDAAHREADDLAQRVLGDLDPMPGESIEQYRERSGKESARFKLSHPAWRGGLGLHEAARILYAPRAARQQGKVTIYVSHGAPDIDGAVDWFIVEPRLDPGRQVESLRRHGRTVVWLRVRPFTLRHRIERWRRMRRR